jgi:hypothetical protein
MSYMRPTAEIRASWGGGEFRVFVDGSYRTTTMSEYDAREWCRKRGFQVEGVRR